MHLNRILNKIFIEEKQKKNNFYLLHKFEKSYFDYNSGCCVL